MVTGLRSHRTDDQFLVGFKWSFGEHLFYGAGTLQWHAHVMGVRNTFVHTRVRRIASVPMTALIVSLCWCTNIVVHQLVPLETMKITRLALVLSEMGREHQLIDVCDVATVVADKRLTGPKRKNPVKRPRVDADWD